MTATIIDDELQQWQHWRRERAAAATAPHGLASVTGTHWLDDTPQRIIGLPGTWTVADAAAVEARTATGAAERFGDLAVTVVRRDGQTALRVFDPAAACQVSGVDAFGYDTDWVRRGRFRAAQQDEVQTTHVDGRTGGTPLAGTIELTVGSGSVELVAFATAERLHVVFADPTNGVSTQQFRFLFVDRPATPATTDVVVDFNRAFLPPCAFSDHYLCPLPPAQNRLTVPVTAGETFVVRR